MILFWEGCFDDDDDDDDESLPKQFPIKCDNV